MNESPNAKLIQQCYDAFGRGDIPALLAQFSENIEWRSVAVEGSPFAKEYRGHNEVARFFKQLDEVEEITRFEPREFIAQGERVVVLGSYAAKVKATGRTYESDWAHVFSVKDGKVIRMQEYADTAVMAKAYQKS